MGVFALPQVFPMEHGGHSDSTSLGYSLSGNMCETALEAKAAILKPDSNTTSCKHSSAK